MARVRGDEPRPRSIAATGTLPGWALMAALALAGYLLSDLLASRIAVVARNPIEPVTLALGLGLLLRNAGWVPRACETGVRSYEAPLKLGIVLLGLGLTLPQVLHLGASALGVVVTCLLIAPGVILLLGHRLRIPQKLSILIGLGTTICGSTAIAVAAPAIEARDEEVAYAIGTISLFGVLTMLTLPVVGAAIGMSAAEFGMWVGTSVPATPQVIGAASMYSDRAIASATVVKMTRNLFIIPAVFLLGVWYARRKARASGKPLGGSAYWKALPAFLLGFLALVLIRSLVDHFGVLPRPMWERILDGVAWATRGLVLVGMAGIGLSTRLDAMRKVGGAPLVVALVGTAFLGAVSYGLIRGLGVAE